MFCKYCGTPSETEVCPNCAAQRSQPTQAPRAPQAAPTGNFAKILKTNLNYIIIGIAALALIWGLLNLFSVFEVNVTASVSMFGMSETETESMPVSEAAEGLEELEGGPAAIYIGNILFGLACLATAAIGVLYYLKQTKNMPYYDQYIGSKLKFTPMFIMGALGAAGAVLQVILYLFAGASEDYFKVSVGVNWTTWLMLVIFAGVAVLDMFVLNKKEQPVQQF